MRPLAARRQVGAGLAQGTVAGSIPAPSRAALLFWYGLNEASGQNAIDSSASALTLTQTGSNPSIAGKVGTARCGGNAGNYLSRYGGVFGNLAGRDCTLTCWVKSDRQLTSVAFNASGTDVEEFDMISIYGLCGSVSGKLFPRLSYYVNQTLPTSLVSSDVTMRFNFNTWTFLAFVISYIDGNDSAGEIWTNATRYANPSIDSIYAVDLKGLTLLQSLPASVGIDELNLWVSAPGEGGALTDDQVAWLYNGGAGRAYAELP